MPTSLYGGVVTPDGSVAPNVPDSLLSLADSLEGTTIPRFASPAARDIGAATLVGASEKGMVCYVDGYGWFGRHDGVWVRLSCPKLTYQTGTSNLTSDTNGMFTIYHNLGSADVSVYLTPIQNGPDPAPEYQAARIKPVVRDKQATYIVGRVFDTTTGAQMASASFLLDWRIELRS